VRTENINHAFLDGVLDGSHEDVYYHFGVVSSDRLLTKLRDVKGVVMAGSGSRIKEFAERWSELNGGTEIVAFPKEDRFVTRYTAGVLFASHGMGMPSASIALQELMRMVFFLKRGDLDAMDEVFWCRVGTSGGVGLPGGTVVVSSEGLMADLKPYRLLNGGTGGSGDGGSGGPGGTGGGGGTSGTLNAGTAGSPGAPGTNATGTAGGAGGAGGAAGTGGII